MKYIGSIAEIFVEGIDFSISEDFSSAVVEFETSTIKLPGEDELLGYINKIPKRDSISIDISYNDTDPSTYHRGDDTATFLGDVRTFQELSDEKDVFRVKITINKNLGGEKILSVYSFQALINYLNNQKLKGILYDLKRLIEETKYVTFLSLNDEIKDFFTSSFFFTADNPSSFHGEQINRFKMINKRDKVCNFINSSDYPFIPEDFHLEQRSNIAELNNIFDKLCLIFSTIYIADISRIETDKDTFYYRLNGYKLVENSIDLTNFIVGSNELQKQNELFDVYEWIYSEGGISDRIGLARNVFSLNHTNEAGKIHLKKNTLSSILSAYEIYLKDNVEKYIEVKNQVTQFLMDLSLRASDLVRTYGNALKNNTLVLLTFFISVFVFNSLSAKRMTNIFTKDISYISFAILLISLFYLFVSFIISIVETNRFKEQFYRMRDMYDDILEQSDLGNIFREKSLQKDISYVKKKMAYLSAFWLIEIIVLFIAVWILKVPLK